MHAAHGQARQSDGDGSAGSKRILLPAASAPAAVVVNENVAAAPVLPATRSPLAIANKTTHTESLLQIVPEETLEDNIKSALVDIVMPDEIPC